jgi:uncharacterized UPF0160 family protein
MHRARKVENKCRLVCDVGAWSDSLQSEGEWDLYNHVNLTLQATYSPAYILSFSSFYLSFNLSGKTSYIQFISPPSLKFWRTRSIFLTDSRDTLI